MTLSRRQFMVGAGVGSLELLASCGRLPWQAQPAKLARIGFLASFGASLVACAGLTSTNINGGSRSIGGRVSSFLATKASFCVTVCTHAGQCSFSQT